MCGYNLSNYESTLDLGPNFSTDNVKDMSGMFYSCFRETLKKFDLGKNFNTTSCNDFSEMFYCCGMNSIEEFSLGDGEFYIGDKTNVSDMFGSLFKLKTFDIRALFKRPCDVSRIKFAYTGASRATIIVPYEDAINQVLSAYTPGWSYSNFEIKPFE